MDFYSMELFPLPDWMRRAFSASKCIGAKRPHILSFTVLHLLMQSWPRPKLKIVYECPLCGVQGVETYTQGT